MLVAGMGQLVGQVAVVSEQHQPFAVQIKPSNRVEMSLQRNQLPCGWMLAADIFIGDDARRLVEEDVVIGVRHAEALTIHSDVVYNRVSAHADGCHLPVHRHPPLLDNLFTGPP